MPFQGVAAREATLVEGPAGWGELSPFPGYPTDPDLGWAAALEAARDGWPPPVRPSVAVAAAIPATDPEQAAALALAAAGRDAAAQAATGADAPALALPAAGVPAMALPGAGVAAMALPGAGVAAALTVKVKVGRGDDLGRVRAVREALGPNARIRVDANGAWDVEEAVARIRALARFDLELVEQPVASLDDLARVRRRVGVPVAADEAVRSRADARRLAGLDAADVVVLKVQALGGVRAALAAAEAARVPAIVSSLVETSVGLAAGLALAACLPELPYACGLGTGVLLAGDVVRDPLVPVGGRLEIRRPIPDPELLARWAVAA